jgi:hypothetical protein
LRLDVKIVKQAGRIFINHSRNANHLTETNISTLAPSDEAFHHFLLALMVGDCAMIKSESESWEIDSVIRKKAFQILKKILPQHRSLLLLYHLEGTWYRRVSGIDLPVFERKNKSVSQAVQ